MPVEAVWGVKYPEPGMIRMSLGFENRDLLGSCYKAGTGGVITMLPVPCPLP